MNDEAQNEALSDTECPVSADTEPSIPQSDNQASEENKRDVSALEKELEKERTMRIKSENRLFCIALLTKYALPAELSDYLTAENEEETRKRVESVSKLVKKAINDEVSRHISTVKPEAEGKSTMTRAEFKSLSLSDMQKLYRTDKELYKELSSKNN